MTEDEQEALSSKYSNEVRLVLVLSSGKIAMFGNDRKLHGVYDSWEQIATCYKFVTVEPPAKPRGQISLDLNDLGI